jgi:PTS system nitrogen regulatory IIA component
MDVCGLIKPDRIVTDLRVRNKHQLLYELSKKAAGDLDRRTEDIFDPITARERLGSTGVGMGTAIPHARLPGLEALYGIFARLNKSIDYEAVDGARVDLVFFLLLPVNADKENLVLLAETAKRARFPELLVKHRDAASAEGFTEAW